MLQYIWQIKVNNAAIGSNLETTIRFKDRYKTGR